MREGRRFVCWRCGQVWRMKRELEPGYYEVVKSRGSGKRDYKGQPLDEGWRYCFDWYTLSAERERLKKELREAPA